MNATSIITAISALVFVLCLIALCVIIAKKLDINGKIARLGGTANSSRADNSYKLISVNYIDRKTKIIQCVIGNFEYIILSSERGDMLLNKIEINKNNS